MKPWEHSSTGRVRPHSRENGQVSGPKNAETVKWGPDREQNKTRAVVEASIHTPLRPFRDRPFYADKITAPTCRKWDAPVWEESDEPPWFQIPPRSLVVGTIISARQIRFRNDTGESLPSMDKIWTRMVSHQMS